MKKVWQKGLQKGLKIVLKKDLKKGFIDCLIRRLGCRIQKKFEKLY